MWRIGERGGEILLEIHAIVEFYTFLFVTGENSKQLQVIGAKRGKPHDHVITIGFGSKGLGRFF